MTKKIITTIAIVVVAITGWLVAAHFFGPESNRAITKQVERLKQDSIALQGNFLPKGRYTFIQDICGEVEDLRDLGNPLRFGSSETDSIRMFSNPRTASIAKYNMIKCDSVLAKVLPLWRASALLALNHELKQVNENTIVKTNSDYPEYTGISIYSLKYISNEEMENDARKYNRKLRNLGFKSAIYAVSPEMPGIEYSLE